MATETPKNILIAPLDWGLGHTSRCVPLIGYLLQVGHKPIVAGNSSQRSFIHDTFGASVETVQLDGYNITYSKWNKVAQLGLLAQLPGITAAVGREHSWLQQKATELQLHGVIADNRYGLHHPQLPSVIITHQLQVLSGMGSMADSLVRRLHYKLLSRFGNVWVPDSGDAINNLGGKLSHPLSLPPATTYMGLLSRFNTVTAQLQAGTVKTLMILLSGPEPQRTILSHLLWAQVMEYKGRVVFVEGSNAGEAPANIPANISYYKRLTNEQLQPLLMAADMVICRSGYSTLMDLIALGKRAVLIPTPGQTEQEYLARHLHAQGMFYTAKQDDFNMQQALTAATLFPFKSTALQTEYTGYKAVLDGWLQQL